MSDDSNIVPFEKKKGRNVTDGDFLEREAADALAFKMASQLAPFELLRGKRVVGTDIQEGGLFILQFENNIDLAINGHVSFKQRVICSCPAGTYDPGAVHQEGCPLYEP